MKKQYPITKRGAAGQFAQCAKSNEVPIQLTIPRPPGSPNWRSRVRETCCAVEHVRKFLENGPSADVGIPPASGALQVASQPACRERKAARTEIAWRGLATPRPALASHRLAAVHHPRLPELIDQHPKALCPEGLLNRHFYIRAFR